MQTQDLIEYSQLLLNLPTDRNPLWGMMTPQHMVEHLSASIRMSNGKLQLNQSITDADIPKRLAFLNSDAPFPKNIRQQNSPEGLRPLRCDNMTEAMALLHEMLHLFEQHFSEKPDDTPIHPLFGPLNKNQWLRFHFRHMQHHFAQFGLIEPQPYTT
ncbi:MAG: hypothetical protein C0424_09935 [Sphingobacteriaceae bacterium]|nr:hypothetical protein [Sphingobacteriaceae bacterium]